MQKSAWGTQRPRPNSSTTPPTMSSVKTQSRKMPARGSILGILFPETGDSFITRGKMFNKFVDWAFQCCKPDEEGQVSEANLYSGLLLVHITLARYVGPVACFPPSRDVVAKIFEARDLNDSGGIGRREFVSIAKSFLTQMAGRMATYVFILVLVVPRIVRQIMAYFDIDHDSYTELVAHQTISFGVFVSVVNVLWHNIDETVKTNAIEKKERVCQARALEAKRSFGADHIETTDAPSKKID